MTFRWSSDQYVLFERERTRPVRDLLAAVAAPSVRRALDVGCGPGNSTEVLAQRYPGADVAGIDSSPEMIDAARRRLPRLRFDVMDIGDFLRTDDPTAPPDLILANAVLQWVADHARLLPALIRRLAPGGTLAAQLPDNLAEPVQTLMRDIAAAGPWAARLAHAEDTRVPIEPAQWYYTLLAASCSRIDLWRTTYYHPLAGADAIVEWFKGTGLRPYMDPLDDAERARFLARYTAAVAAAYPALADGTVLLPFPRLFIVATRGTAAAP